MTSRSVGVVGSDDLVARIEAVCAGRDVEVIPSGDPAPGEPAASDQPAEPDEPAAPDQPATPGEHGPDVDAIVDAAPATVVAEGEAGVLAVVRADASLPILPVDAGRGLRSVPANRVEAAVEAVLTGDASELELPLLGVDVPDVSTRALFDVAAFTSQPAHISEYRVCAAGEPVVQCRADGVVVATPAGTHGYAGAAGGPTVDPRADVLAVVPVAPFVTRHERWVVPIEDELTLSIERDEGPITLRVDDRAVTELAAGSSVTVSRTGSARLLVVEESASPFGR